MTTSALFLLQARDATRSEGQARAAVPLAETLPDAALMKRVARGDAEAFALVYRRFERRIFNYLLRLGGGSRPLAEDLLQETFTRVWMAARSWDADRGTLRAWIYRIAHNTARSELRRKRHQVDHVPMVEDLHAGSASSQERRLDEASRAEAVRTAVDALPEYLREVVRLRCEEQLPFGEIAQITGAPVGTLKSRFHRAMLSLRSSFADRDTPR